MARMTAAQAIAHWLKSIGTEYYFLYNGHANWGLLDALEYEAKITGIRTRHEAHAIHMADNYWRQRRTLPIPVTCTTSGPGNYNAIPGIAEAFFDSTPMLCLMAGGPTKWFGRGGIQETYRYTDDEFVNILRPITKQAVMVTRPDTALDTVIRAYKTAITGRPGPVVVYIPLDIQNTEIDVELPGSESLAIHQPGPDPAAIERAMDIIQQADRPVLQVSGGIHNSRAWDELRDFAELLGIPVSTTFAGKGAFPESHPLSLGVCDRSGTGHSVKANGEADVVIGIGTRFNDLNTAGWTFYDIPANQKLVHIDIDPTEIGRVYPPAVGLVSDARLALSALAASARARDLTPRTDEWVQTVQQWRDEWREETTDLRTSDLAPLHYARLVADASDVINEFDPETSVICDTGMIMCFLPAFYTLDHPRLATNNHQFGQMGFAPPGVVGARLARPDHPVVVFVGDQSFIHTGLSLATATEYGIPGVVIVLNNATVQTEIEGAFNRYGRGVGDYYKIESTQEPWNPNLVGLATAMGAKTITVSHPDQFAPALKAALESDELWVIDVECSTEVPKFAVPLVQEHGTMPFPATWDQ